MKPFSLSCAACILLFLGVVAMAFSLWYTSTQSEQAKLGVTFSSVYADQLGLDAKASFKAILEDLQVKRVRLPLYWSQIESSPGVYDWRLVDWLIEEAQKEEVDLTLALGAKVPRWPECYIPKWATSFSDRDRFLAQELFVRRAVERYKDQEAVVRWQIENEPFFPFGDCPNLNPDAVFEEASLVRSLDNRPIQMTASGELSSWYEYVDQADILGVSLYRTTWNPWFGFFQYPIPSTFYRLRMIAAGPFYQQVIISELQAEPWFPEPISTRPLGEWAKLFTASDLKNNVAFARETGADEIYLWGAEWWYLLRQHNEPDLWRVAQELFML